MHAPAFLGLFMIALSIAQEIASSPQRLAAAWVRDIDIDGSLLDRATKPEVHGWNVPDRSVLLQVQGSRQGHSFGPRY